MESAFKLTFLSLFFILINVITAKTLLEPESLTGNWQPQQTHIALGDQEDEIVVTWVTTRPSNSVLQYGPDLNFQYEQTGHQKRFTNGGFLHRAIWIHRVYLTNLAEDTLYVYRCGSVRGWSEVFYFKTMKKGNDGPITIAMYGDLGLKNSQSLSRLQMEAENGRYDTMVHIGGIAYDMDSKNGLVGDEFLNTIEPIAAHVPYMVCPGSPEQAYNFSNYKARFSMPLYEQTESMFYSWNMGPVHFIAVNTEAYYYLNYGQQPLDNLYQWLIDDLEEATKPEIREERPWIILYGHRPMYCSNDDGDDCTKEDCLLRVGLPEDHQYGMEKLLAKYGVDLAVWAHEHSYERLWPIYDYEVLNGTAENPYQNPRGPVHLMTGAAGSKSEKDPFQKKKPDWSAFRSSDYGYTRLTVHNMTHLYWEQVSDDQDGATVDEVWLIRDSHEPYSHLL